MRLVDADNARECFSGDGVTGAVMQRMFDSLPTIDAVPVVRCRECKYYEVDAGWTDGRACLMHHHRTTACRPDDFCSRGERKEAAHEISE